MKLLWFVIWLYYIGVTVITKVLGMWLSVSFHPKPHIFVRIFYHLFIKPAPTLANQPASSAQPNCGLLMETALLTCDLLVPFHARFFSRLLYSEICRSVFNLENRLKRQTWPKMKSGKLYYVQISSFSKLSIIQFISLFMSTQIKPCKLHNDQFTCRKCLVSSNPLLSQECHSCSFTDDNKSVKYCSFTCSGRTWTILLEVQTNRIYHGASNTNWSTDKGV